MKGNGWDCKWVVCDENVSLLHKCVAVSFIPEPYKNKKIRKSENKRENYIVNVS